MDCIATQILMTKIVLAFLHKNIGLHKNNGVLNENC